MLFFVVVCVHLALKYPSIKLVKAMITKDDKNTFRFISQRLTREAGPWR